VRRPRRDSLTLPVGQSGLAGRAANGNRQVVVRRRAERVVAGCPPAAPRRFISTGNTGVTLQVEGGGFEEAQ